MSGIVVEGLGKRYVVEQKAAAGRRRPSTELWALKDVSFSAREGEVLGVIGRNGAGKTTLLKVLGRVTVPTAGRAVLHGRVVSLLEMGLGFQPDLTARENIHLSAALYGVSQKELARHFDEIIGFSGLEAFIDGPPLRHFSSGMYLRLAFSVAVNMRPDILLADEILAVGDIAFREMCAARMKEIGRKGSTVLFVSHDMEAIERLCSRCIRLDAGRLVGDGSPSEVVDAYRKAMWDVQARPLADSGARSNAYGEVLSAELVGGDGRQLGAVKASEDFFVQVSIRTFVPNVKLVCGLNLYAGQTPVFRSVSPEGFVAGSPGVYRTSCRVSAGLLSDIGYRATVFAGIVECDGAPVERKVVLYDALQFTVYPSSESLSRGKAFVEARSFGVVAPGLEWSPALPVLADSPERGVR